MGFLRENAFPARSLVFKFTPSDENYCLKTTLMALSSYAELRGMGVVARAHRWLDEKQDPKTGAWGGEDVTHEQIVNGMFKVLQSYVARNWPIHHMERMTDYVLSGTDPRKGFTGEGCSLFDPIMVLCVLREHGCAYRADDVDEAAARTFLTLKDLWSDELGWYKSDNWNAKHNHGAPAYMALLLLKR